MRQLAKAKLATNILSVPSLKGSSKEKCGHPSQKPLELITQLILCCTDPGDLVLDPFLGSGTTAVAAEMHGRNWIGVETNEDYCSICERRLREMRGLFGTEKGHEDDFVDGSAARNVQHGVDSTRFHSRV